MPTQEEELKKLVDEAVVKQMNILGQVNGALQQYQQSPREYLHNFLLQAKNTGCSVDSYIDGEIKLMLAELAR